MKKLLTILLLIMLIISFFQIANTYALYKEQLQGNYTNLLGVWAIKVNGVDISSGGENLTFDMSENNLTYIDSQLIKNGKIAPGGQACFEIAIDPSDTDVSILYTLSIKLSLATIKVGDDNSQSVAPSMKLVKIENYFQKDGEAEKVTNETAQMGEETETALIPIEKGDIVIVKLGENTLNEKDIITYKSGNAIITHRIKKIDGNTIIAKGDSNNTEDDPIEKDMVIGKVVYIFNNVEVWKKVFSDMQVIVPICITIILLIVLVLYKEKTGDENVE